MQKRLYRATEGKMVAGVCAGIAEYLNLDPTVVRFVWVLLCLLGFSGVIAYIIAVFIIPEKPLAIE